MLTARAEYRLRLRADNAVTRLGAAALESGAVGPERCVAIEQRLTATAEVADLMARSVPAKMVGGVGGPQTLSDWTRQLDLSAEALVSAVPALQNFDGDVVAEAQDDARYAPYLERQAAEVARIKGDAALGLGRIADYRSVGGLSTEMVQRLEAAQPRDLAAASRIRGITPAALSAILVAARRAA